MHVPGSVRASAAVALVISDWDTSAPFCEYLTFTPGAHATSTLSGFLTPECVPLSLTVYTPQAIRASLVFYFLVTNIAAFALYARAGLVHRDTLANIGILLPGLLVGFGLATLVTRRLDAQVFRYVALAVIVVGGALLLGREIAGL